jgi:hypothetical protein
VTGSASVWLDDLVSAGHITVGASISSDVLDDLIGQTLMRIGSRDFAGDISVVSGPLVVSASHPAVAVTTSVPALRAVVSAPSF